MVRARHPPRPIIIPRTRRVPVLQQLQPTPLRGLSAVGQSRQVERAFGQKPTARQRLSPRRGPRAQHARQDQAKESARRDVPGPIARLKLADPRRPLHQQTVSVRSKLVRFTQRKLRPANRAARLVADQEARPGLFRAVGAKVHPVALASALQAARLLPTSPIRSDY